MLRKAQRLNSKQIDQIMKTGRVVHSPVFMARFLKTDTSKRAESTLSAIAPVKIAKTSAKRHLVRRRMYEAARDMLKKASPGYEVALIAKEPCVKMKPAQMVPEIQALFVKAGIMR